MFISMKFDLYLSSNNAHIVMHINVIHIIGCTDVNC